MSPRVDLVVNCFERTYRDVLKAGFFPRIEEQNHYPLDKIAIITMSMIVGTPSGEPTS